MKKVWKLYAIFICILSVRSFSQNIPIDELISISSLPAKRVDSLLRAHHFMYTRSSKDTVFYDYDPVDYDKGTKKYSIFKVSSVWYYKGDFIYPRSLVKKLVLSDIDEFEDRTYWNFFYKEHLLSLKFNKLDRSFLLRIAKI
jgi:hypothetical protein